MEVPSHMVLILCHTFSLNCLLCHAGRFFGDPKADVCVSKPALLSPSGPGSAPLGLGRDDKFKFGSFSA